MRLQHPRERKSENEKSQGQQKAGEKVKKDKEHKTSLRLVEPGGIEHPTSTMPL